MRRFKTGDFVSFSHLPGVKPNEHIHLVGLIVDNNEQDAVTTCENFTILSDGKIYTVPETKIIKIRDNKNDSPR